MHNDRTITFIVKKEQRTARLWPYSQEGMKSALVSAFPDFRGYPLEFSCNQITDSFSGLHVYGKYEISEPDAQ